MSICRSTRECIAAEGVRCPEGKEDRFTQGAELALGSGVACLEKQALADSRRMK